MISTVLIHIHRSSRGDINRCSLSASLYGVYLAGLRDINIELVRSRGCPRRHNVTKLSFGALARVASQRPLNQKWFGTGLGGEHIWNGLFHAFASGPSTNARSLLLPGCNLVHCCCCYYMPMHSPLHPNSSLHEANPQTAPYDQRLNNYIKRIEGCQQPMRKYCPEVEIDRRFVNVQQSLV